MSALISVLSLPSLETCNIDGVDCLWTDFSRAFTRLKVTLSLKEIRLTRNIPTASVVEEKLQLEGVRIHDIYNIKALYVVMKDFVDFSWLREASISTHTGRSLDSHQTRH